MKITVLYRSNSEKGTPVEQYAREFTRRTSRKLELVDVDSKEGQRIITLYDIVRHPAFLAIDNGGQLINTWFADETLPLIDEISGYTLEH